MKGATEEITAKFGRPPSIKRDQDLRGTPHGVRHAGASLAQALARNGHRRRSMASQDDRRKQVGAGTILTLARRFDGPPQPGH
jgi:hypothetical protein